MQSGGRVPPVKEVILLLGQQVDLFFADPRISFRICAAVAAADAAGELTKTEAPAG